MLSRIGDHHDSWLETCLTPIRACRVFEAATVITMTEIATKSTPRTGLAQDRMETKGDEFARLRKGRSGTGDESNFVDTLQEYAACPPEFSLECFSLLRC